MPLLSSTVVFLLLKFCLFCSPQFSLIPFVYTAFLYPHSLYHPVVFIDSIIAYSFYEHRISTFTISSRSFYRLNSRLCTQHFYIHIHFIIPSFLSVEFSLMYSAFLYPHSLYHPVVFIGSIIAYSRYVHRISISTFTLSSPRLYRLNYRLFSLCTPHFYIHIHFIISSSLWPQLSLIPVMYTAFLYPHSLYRPVVCIA